ncbi:MAG: hypothetical protein GYA48_00835 [Chloroflexi bacterium]|nr:hypothetical protein [Chloroflexota bacterium]
MIAFLKWYFWITLLGLLGLPVVARLFPYLKDKGYAFARIAGLLIWSFSYWLLASLGVLQNDAGGQWVALILLAAAGLWSARQIGWTMLWHTLRTQWRTVLVSELLFLLAFAGMAALRAADPVISGTEKPMELAFINAILRSENFPPHDPWLSGYSISYYYFGYVMSAMLTRITATATGIGFNLSIALWFALTAQGAFGIVFHLLSARREERGEPRRAIGTALQALLAPLFILVVSNLEGFLEVLHSAGWFWKQNENGEWVSPFWTWLDIQELVNPPTPPFTGQPERIGGIWWWRASRVLQDFDLAGNSKEIIDEFPFFTFLLSDLHPHLLSMPFVLLAVAAAMNLYYGREQYLLEGQNIFAWLRDFVAGANQPLRETFLVKRLSHLEFWFSAMILGSLAFLNTWDFPIYVGIYSLAIGLVLYERSGWSRELIWKFLESGVVMGITAILFYFPFYVGFSSQAGGFLPSLSFYTRGVFFWVMFLPLLAPIFIWAWMHWRSGARSGALKNGLKFSGFVVGGLWLFSFLVSFLILSLTAAGSLLAGGEGRAAAWMGELSALGGLFAGLHGSADSGYLLLSSFARRLAQPGTWITLFGFLALVWGGLFCLRGEGEPGAEQRPQPKSAGFVLLLALMGAGLTLVPEFIYLRDQFGWRMNTIFKFYYQAWIVWGLAAAYATVITSEELKKGWRLAFQVLSAVVIFMGLSYPYYGVYYKFQGLPSLSALNLDGTAYIEEYNPDEAQAIEWLQAAPVGALAESVGGSYTGYARISTHTGQPNVLGWPGHESQWRGGSAEMGSRQSDIITLYETNSWEAAREIIDRYDIRYIYVGGLEWQTYRVNVDKFQGNLAKVFENETVTIYAVSGPEAVSNAN